MPVAISHFHHSPEGVDFPMDPFNTVTKNKLIFSLIALGALIVLASLRFDASGAGKGGIGPAQLSITTIGAAMCLLGIGLRLGNRENTPCATQVSWLGRIPSLPNLVWVVLGFLVAYILFLIVPMFFSRIHAVVYYNRYIPNMNPIGWDINITLESVGMWFAKGDAKVFYPPLVTILFSPLVLMKYPLNYYTITILTIISYFLVSLLLPLLIREKKGHSIVTLVFGISVFSYGLQFELERGQFHTIAWLLCLAAVYLYHRVPRYRFFAYLLFCVSVQFKLYTAIFIVLLVEDWRDWKTILKRFAVLGLVNVLLLFLLGPSYFSKFIRHMTKSTLGAREVWNGNHSISGFLNYLLTPKAQLLNTSGIGWLGRNIQILTYLFMAYFLLCFLLVWLSAYRRNTHDIDSLLIMVCILGGLLIPSINHDYTLPLLAAPFALMVSEPFTLSFPKRIPAILLLLVSSFTYAITLIPFVRKPLYLKNDFPLLIILLTATALLSFLRDQEPPVSPLQSEL
jgi:hypothetical protein